MNTPYMVMLLGLFCLLSSVASAKRIKQKDACQIPTDDPKCARLPKKGCNCPKNPGTFGYIRDERWFYNKRTKNCESFAWSWNGGNCNNFKSYSDCFEACKTRAE
uniref:Putative bpti/kunitz family of serine protease inhibitor n=1 Tax=Amblyomma tuberculatum TaxID=48802 RepID=A0A6M2E2Z2_9ACAR